MSRLVTFGCSHTYGHGLADCLMEGNQPGHEPSKLAWPVILGDMLKLETVNMSKPGASNLEILYHLLRFEFQKDDCVIILWSHIDRDLIFLEKPAYYDGPLIMPIGSWGNAPKEFNVDAWLQVHTRHDMTMRSLLYIHHAENYLENLSLKNDHFSAESDMFKNIPSYLKFKHLHNLPLWGPIMTSKRANDGTHMGLLGHKIVAEEIYKTI